MSPGKLTGAASTGLVGDMVYAQPESCGSTLAGAVSP
jgi:hypothetical protein